MPFQDVDVGLCGWKAGCLATAVDKSALLTWKWRSQSHAYLPSFLPPSLLQICYPCHEADKDKIQLIQLRTTRQVIRSCLWFSTSSVVNACQWGLIRGVETLTCSVHFNNAVSMPFPGTFLPLIFRYFSFQATANQPSHVSPAVSFNSLTCAPLFLYKAMTEHTTWSFAHWEDSPHCRLQWDRNTADHFTCMHRDTCLGTKLALCPPLLSNDVRLYSTPCGHRWKVEKGIREIGKSGGDLGHVLWMCYCRFTPSKYLASPYVNRIRVWNPGSVPQTWWKITTVTQWASIFW